MTYVSPQAGGRIEAVRRLAAGLLAAACSLLVLPMPAWGATGAWDRTWGKDVVSGNAETGPEVCTVAALCKAGEEGSSDGELDRPRDVAVAPNGNVYVADGWNNRIDVFADDGTFIRAFGPFNQINSIAIDGDAAIKIAEDTTGVLK